MAMPFNTFGRRNDTGRWDASGVAGAFAEELVDNGFVRDIVISCLVVMIMHRFRLPRRGQRQN